MANLMIPGRTQFGGNVVTGPSQFNVPFQRRDLSGVNLFQRNAITPATVTNPAHYQTGGPISRPLVDGDAQYQAAIARTLADISARLAALEGGGAGFSAGPVSAGNRNANIAAFASPPRVGKGGVIKLSNATFAAGALAGVTATSTLSEATRARATETVWELAGVHATGDLADVDELGKISVTVTINGDPVPALYQVPCDLAAATLTGLQLIPVQRRIGADSNIVATFTVDEDLTTASAADITIRGWFGDGDTYLGLL